MLRSKDLPTFRYKSFKAPRRRGATLAEQLKNQGISNPEAVSDWLKKEDALQKNRKK